MTISILTRAPRLIESYMGGGVRASGESEPSLRSGPPLALELDKPVLQPTHVRFFFLPLQSKMYLLWGKTLQCFDDV